MDSTRRNERREEIVAELESASYYFERILTEKDFGQLLHLSVIEQQVAQRIYENILYLQWRLDARSQVNH